MALARPTARASLCVPPAPERVPITELPKKNARLNDATGLPEIEAVEWLVHEQHVLRRQETEC